MFVNSLKSFLSCLLVFTAITCEELRKLQLFTEFAVALTQ